MTEDVDSTFKPSLTTISIGPGIRGIERGIENSGTRLDHIAYMEIEALIIENLVSEMEKGLLAPAIIWSDCKTFPAELFRGKVNLLLAGYPCQPFSHAGMRKGTEDPRHLYPYIERTIDIIRPHAVFLENVRGHITLGLREVIASLEGLGYRVRWGIFSAEETGASHKRERVFILAVREECLEFSGCNGRESVSAFKSIRDKKRNCTPSERRWQNIECGIVSTSELGYSTCINQCWQWKRIQGGRWSMQIGRSSDEIISNASSLGIFKGMGRKQSELINKNGEARKIELANTNNRSIIDFTTGHEEDGQDERLQQRNIGEKFSESMAVGNANISRPQGRFSEKCRECTYEWTSGQNGPFCPEQSVARPGQRQHDWESPRTIITKQTARLLGGYGKKYPENFSKEQLDQVAFDDFTGTIKPHLDMSVDGYNFREDFLRALGNSVYADTAELAWVTLWDKMNATKQ